MKKRTNKTKKNIKYKKGGMKNISPANFNSSLSSFSVSQELSNEDTKNLRDIKTKSVLNNDFANTLKHYINNKYSGKTDREKQIIFDYLKRDKQTQKNYQRSVIANNTMNPRLFYDSYNSEFDNLYKGFGGKLLKKRNKTLRKKDRTPIINKEVRNFLDNYYPPSEYINPNSSIN